MKAVFFKYPDRNKEPMGPIRGYAFNVANDLGEVTLVAHRFPGAPGWRLSEFSTGMGIPIVRGDTRAQLIERARQYIGEDEPQLLGQIIRHINTNPRLNSLAIFAPIAA